MPDPLFKVGRLAFRQEGQLWVAYYADPESMDGAIYLGSVQLAFVTRDPKRKDQFVGMMREAVGDIIEEKVGIRPVWPDGLQPAPEHERGVHVPNAFLK